MPTPYAALIRTLAERCLDKIEGYGIKDLTPADLACLMREKPVELLKCAGWKSLLKDAAPYIAGHHKNDPQLNYTLIGAQLAGTVSACGWIITVEDVKDEMDVLRGERHEAFVLYDDAYASFVAESL